jgi:long-chain acyl-CoA synthetase
MNNLTLQANPSPMTTVQTLTFSHLLNESVKKNGQRPALAFVGEEPLTYRQLYEQIEALQAFLEKLGVKPGDRLAILSQNSPNWGVAYLAIVTMGAVVVPVLPDFSPAEVENIMTHSGARILFVSSGLRAKVDGFQSNRPEHIILTEDFSLQNPAENAAVYMPGDKPTQTYSADEEDVAAIIYTSGTTGKSKGVMLSQKNICFTALQCGTVQPIGPEDRMMSILPLSHTYENTIGFVFPLFNGASVYYLSKPPTPTILLPALKLVKPTLMLTVPLIIEKIYHNKIKPTFHKNRLTRFLYSFPPIRKKLNLLAGKKLRQTFGGALKFYGIGGAKLSETVEKFLIEARFPIAIGYGLTETAPLLAGSNPQNHRLQSTGPVLQGVTLKINEPDPVTGEGEIWAKGPNLMKGYYKEPELTEEVITPDGWFRTGDLGIFDKDGFLSIRGRKKNVIIGANGENIYPEEIESVINNFRFVTESLVIEEKGKLVALVHFNREEIEALYQSVKHEIASIEDRIEEIQKDLHKYINARLNRNSQIQKVIAHWQPFHKTATQKIKRFLYQHPEKGQA